MINTDQLSCDVCGRVVSFSDAYSFDSIITYMRLNGWIYKNISKDEKAFYIHICPDCVKSL